MNKDHCSFKTPVDISSRKQPARKSSPGNSPVHQGSHISCPNRSAPSSKVRSSLLCGHTRCLAYTCLTLDRGENSDGCSRPAKLFPCHSSALEMPMNGENGGRVRSQPRSKESWRHFLLAWGQSAVNFGRMTPVLARNSSFRLECLGDGDQRASFRIRAGLRQGRDVCTSIDLAGLL